MITNYGGSAQVLNAGTNPGDTLVWNGENWIPSSSPSGGSEQKTWFIDAANGNDRNIGSSAAPLASFRQFQQRMRGVILEGLYTINIIGGLTELPIDFDIGATGYLDIVFFPTVSLGPYTINTFTPANPGGTAEIEKIQTVELATAAGLVNKRIRFLNGPATNCSAWVTEALVGYDDHTFQMTKPASFQRNQVWMDAVPVNGNTFVAETLPIVDSMSVHIRRHAGQGFCFAIRNCQFGTQLAPIQDPIFSVEGWGSTVGCAWWVNGFATDGYHVSDGFLKGSVTRGLATPIDKGRFIYTFFSGTHALSDVVIWNSVFKHGQVVIESGEVHFVALVAIMIRPADIIDDAVFGFSAACRLIINTNGQPDGATLIQGQTRYGFNVPAGMVVAYSVQPIVAVSTAWALVGTTVRAAAANIPYIEPATNAAIIQGVSGSLG